MGVVCGVLESSHKITPEHILKSHQVNSRKNGLYHENQLNLLDIVAIFKNNMVQLKYRGYMLITRVNLLSPSLSTKKGMKFILPQ